MAYLDYEGLGDYDGYVKTALNGIDSRLLSLEAEGKIYGVSGLTNSSPVLTRTDDAIGMAAQVGTDGDNTAVVNDFDAALPFRRRKCVGKWHNIEGRAIFRVHAYEGDADYAEDGTKGDFVAVECPLSFYNMDANTLKISAHQHEGFRPFDIFCHNHDPEELLSHYYLPAYALAKDTNGHAVSLPGFDNEQGDYASLLAAAKTYDGTGLGTEAILQPMAVNFYEWALFTVEFATLNCQNIMKGCSELRHNADDRITFTDATHAITSNYYASRVAGEYIAITPTTVDINDSTKKATHKIVSITRCDASGNADASGTHQLLELVDLGKAYYEYDLTGATEYRIAARPYRTGSCNSVSTPSGSPVSNSDGYHPMKYRHRENAFANQNKTIMDMFNMRVGTGNDDYTLDWYYLPDPTEWQSGNPGASNLAAAPFEKLDVETEHANYVSGYIKSKKYSEEYPDLWIPYETAGGSASTYFCDYAYLVYSYTVRALRVGGSWYSGAHSGLSYVYANYAPSHASAYSGGDLCFAQ